MLLPMDPRLLGKLHGLRIIGLEDYRRGRNDFERWDSYDISSI
jgi:hypothetical protein